ncbi:hypothetical protein [Hyphomicrobium sp. CS1GBMeth3]|uniref:hypothetical protein n=1 Tax=Hyphomicrobium sp. CS1GBMeth3 TaxID=1892845 RepID=UPI00093195DC|nr:hypothetical protein [Hyphomicrobium sp. CS1GBMeth3]
MTITGSTFPLTALILPLLTSGAAWAIAVWALRQDGPRIEFLQRLKQPTGTNGHGPASAPPNDTCTIDNENDNEGDRSAR